MIDAVKQGRYEVYTNTMNGQYTTNNQNSKKDTVTPLNIQDILKDIKAYTYSEEEFGTVDQELLNGLKGKFGIEDKDIYKLKAGGFDLEQLYIEDYSGYMFSDKEEVTKKSFSEEEEKRLNDKLETIKNGSDAMYLSALTSQGDITINSLYQGNFKGNYKKSNLAFEDSEVANVLKMNGIELNEQNTWAAKMLLSYGAEVDAQSVKRLDNIQAAIDSLDAFVEKQKEIEDLNEKAIEDRSLLKDGQIAYSEETIKGLKEELGKITDQDIKEVLEEGKPINIKNLKEMMYKNTKQALGKNNENLSNSIDGELIEDVELVKNQINQIRAKLTTEAAQRISEKMPLESMQLSQIVQEINVLEGQKIEEALQAMEMELTSENKEIIQNVIDTKALMIQNTQATINVEVEQGGEITLEQIKTALASYEENESIPETRFGENINKVESQIEKLLENQSIEINEETVMAAKALITNGLEVTPEQIESVLEIGIKVSVFLEEMTPMVAAKLIKEGINPYKATVDHLLTWMSGEKIEALKGSVAESIVALEEKGQIDMAQKEAMLGLYRIMQGIDEHREEVIGYLYKNNLPLTIEHLQEATKYINSRGKKHQVSVKVNDEFGEIVSKGEAKTARSMLEKSSNEITKNAEVVQLIEGMPLELETDTGNRLRKINAFLYPFIKEQFKAQIGKFEGMATLPESFLEKLEYIKSVNPEVITHMVQSNVPLTVSNIYWFDKINENPNLYAEVLENNQMLKEDLPEKLEEIETQLEEIEAKAKAEKELAVTTGDINKYRNFKQMEEMIQTQKQLIKQEGIYQIPFMVNGEQRLINLQLQKESKGSQEGENGLKAIISYETKNLGKVKAYIELKGDALSYTVQGEDDEATRALANYRGNLNQPLQEVGYIVDKSEFELEKKIQEETLVTMRKNSESIFEEVI